MRDLYLSVVGGLIPSSCKSASSFSTTLISNLKLAAHWVVLSQVCRHDLYSFWFREDQTTQSLTGITSVETGRTNSSVWPISKMKGSNASCKMTFTVL